MHVEQNWPLRGIASTLYSKCEPSSGAIIGMQSGLIIENAHDQLDEIVIGARCCAQGRACLLLWTPDAIID